MTGQMGGMKLTPSSVLNSVSVPSTQMKGNWFDGTDGSRTVSGQEGPAHLPIQETLCLSFWDLWS